jgi:curved DNA-binding protein CbpA
MTNDPYDLLQLEKPTTLDRLEKAYKVAARKYHPDHGGTKEQFQELEYAYKQIKSEIFIIEDEILKFLKDGLKVRPTNVTPKNHIKNFIRLNLSAANGFIQKQKEELRNLRRDLVHISNNGYEEGYTPDFIEVLIQNFKEEIEEAEYNLKDLENKKKTIEAAEKYCFKPQTNTAWPEKYKAIESFYETHKNSRTNNS